MTRTMMVVALVATGFASPAIAQDKLFDARQPGELAVALRDAGYKAELKNNDKGTPIITSSANGDPFTITFYGCTAAIDCGSFEFFSWYKKEPLFTVAFVNEWNTSKRFLRASIDKDGDLALSMDVAGEGKMTQAAFADNVDWFQTMTGEISKFIDDRRAAAKK